MKKQILILFCLFFVLLFWGCTTDVKMPETEQINTRILTKHKAVAALYIPDELKKNYEQITSPLDTLSFPIGPQMTDLLEKNLPLVFEKVVKANTDKVPDNADIVIVPEILDFKNYIPFPAYNPHRCSIIARLTCLNKKNEKVFVQTITGNAQTGGNLFSGFKSQQLAAEAADLAIKDAVKQAIEGLADAEELN
ncbi:MAG: hypothetical protein ABIJ59_10335 [Pseudomonadota bacterium]